MQNEDILKLRSEVHQFIRLFGVLNKTTTPCGYSLSVSQVLTLQALEEHTPLTIHELADQLNLERSTVSRLIDGLVKTGLVHRKINPNNRREVQLFLTEEGNRTIANVRNRSVDFFREMLSSLPDNDCRGILEGFQKFTKALQKVREVNREFSYQ